MIAFIVGALTGPWCWAALIAIALIIFTAFWVPLAAVAVIRQKHGDREALHFEEWERELHTGERLP